MPSRSPSADRRDIDDILLFPISTIPVGIFCWLGSFVLVGPLFSELIPRLRHITETVVSSRTAAVESAITGIHILFLMENHRKLLDPEEKQSKRIFVFVGIEGTPESRPAKSFRRPFMNFQFR